MTTETKTELKMSKIHNGWYQLNDGIHFSNVKRVGRYWWKMDFRNQRGEIVRPVEHIRVLSEAPEQFRWVFASASERAEIPGLG